VLKNGHPAHVFTDEDRRRGAATTNAIKRARRQAFEDEKFERAIEEMMAVDEARRARRHARYERTKRERPAARRPEPYEADVSGYGQPGPDKVAIWLERGYGAVTGRDRAPDA
jgi:hypothetical protein